MPDAPDARDLVTFAELQAKVVGARRKLKMVRHAQGKESVLVSAHTCFLFFYLSSFPSLPG